MAASLEPYDGACVTAVKHDLDALPADLAQSALAATALAMAEGIDHPGNSLTSKSMAAGQLQDVMAALRALAPPAEKKGALHDIKSGRALRLAEGKPGT